MAPLSAKFRQAADAVRRADVILITAGAGMGVDSGLPDFRGNEGLWEYYPPLRHLGVSFSSMANPSWFDTDPALAWGFYGHRLQLYRATVPHAGFSVLQQWGALPGKEAFVFTSNVDGHFQKAGFAEDAVMECHGSINYLQGLRGGGGGSGIEPVPEELHLDVDAATLRVRTAATPLPTLASGEASRPNILMFSDLHFAGRRTEAQEQRMDAFLRRASEGGGKHVAVVELGAGTAVPTVRMMGEHLRWAVPSFASATHVRINTTEAEGADVALPCGCLEALSEIGEMVGQA